MSVGPYDMAEARALRCLTEAKEMGWAAKGTGLFYVDMGSCTPPRRMAVFHLNGPKVPAELKGNTVTPSRWDWIEWLWHKGHKAKAVA